MPRRLRGSWPSITFSPTERSERALLARDRDGPCIDGVHAGESLDQRRLPRAVFTQQRVHLASAQREVDAVQGQDAGEADGDAAHGDERRGLEQVGGHRSLTLGWGWLGLGADALGAERCSAG
jgi:hypothetical protein